MSIVKKIDTFFQERKKSEKYLIYGTIFAGIVAISYQYLLPAAQKFLKIQKSQKDKIEAKLNIDKSYIQAMTVNGDKEYYVKFYRKKIDDEKKKFLHYADKKEYLDQKIKELSYLLYNKKRWASFLNSLTQKAYKNGVEITYISNRFLDITKNFGHVLEVEVGCSGDFKNLISYLNSIEQSDLVVDVYALQMVGANPIQLQFKVSVWGINL